MALSTMHCLECEKDFKPGDWECTPGVPHRVPVKKYFMDDAPTVVQYDALNNRHPYIDKKSARTLVLNIPPERTERDGEEIRRIPGGTVEFIRGRFETSDPQLQFYLDRKAGLCSEARWNEVYLNDDEKLQISQMQVRAAQQRLEQDRNELLERVKALEAKPPEAKPERKKPGPKPKILTENPVRA